MRTSHKTILRRSLSCGLAIGCALALSTPLLAQCDPPTEKPQGIRPLGDGTNPRPTFEWTAVPGATSYTFYVQAEPTGAVLIRETNLTQTTFTPTTDLPLNAQLRWKVKGASSCGEGPYSDLSFFKVNGGGPPCPPNEAPIAEGPSGTIDDPRPTFSWSAVPGASSYTLYVLTNPGDDFALRETQLTNTTFTPADPLPLDIGLRWKVKAESVCGPGPYSADVFFNVVDSDPDPPSGTLDLGYYNVETVRYGRYLPEVTGHSNFVHIGPGDAGFSHTPPNDRLLTLAEFIASAAEAPLDIMLDFELGGPLPVPSVVGAAAAHWGRVKYVVLASHPTSATLPVAQANAEIAALRQELRSQDLDDGKPIGVTLTFDTVMQDDIITANWDFINIEAYTGPCSCGACGAASAEEEVAAVRSRIALMRARIPESKFLTVVMQGYDRNGAFANIPVLAALNRQTYFDMVKGDPRVRALAIFSYGRHGNACNSDPDLGFGTRGHPELLAVHQEIWADIHGGSQVLPDLKVNGQDGPIQIRSDEMLAVTASLIAGPLEGVEGEWWWLSESPLGVLFLDLEAGWQEQVAPSFQVPFGDLPATMIFGAADLPLGTYSFYFVIDTVINGELDISHGDAAVVEIVP